MSMKQLHFKISGIQTFFRKNVIYRATDNMIYITFIPLKLNNDFQTWTIQTSLIEDKYTNLHSQIFIGVHNDTSFDPIVLGKMLTINKKNKRRFSLLCYFEYYNNMQFKYSNTSECPNFQTQFLSMITGNYLNDTVQFSLFHQWYI